MRAEAGFVVGFGANRKAPIRGRGNSGLLRTQIITRSVRFMNDCKLVPSFSGKLIAVGPIVTTTPAIRELVDAVEQTATMPFDSNGESSHTPRIENQTVPA
jgi:hypothetical protein